MWMIDWLIVSCVTPSDLYLSLILPPSYFLPAPSFHLFPLPFYSISPPPLLRHWRWHGHQESRRVRDLRILHYNVRTVSTVRTVVKSLSDIYLLLRVNLDYRIYFDGNVIIFFSIIGIQGTRAAQSYRTIWKPCSDLLQWSSQTSSRYLQELSWAFK